MTCNALGPEGLRCDRPDAGHVERGDRLHQHIERFGDIGAGYVCWFDGYRHPDSVDYYAPCAIRESLRDLGEALAAIGAAWGSR